MLNQHWCASVQEVDISILWGYIPRSGTARSHSNHLAFRETTQLSSAVAYFTFQQLQQRRRVPISLYPHQHLSSEIAAILMGVKAYLDVILICISLKF